MPWRADRLNRLADRIAACRLWRRGVLVGSGAAMALGQAPWGLWPVTLVALAVALAVLARAEGRRAVLGGTLGLGTAHFLVALHWIHEPFLVDVARHGWMAPFALVLMALGAGLFWSAGVGLVRALAPGRGPVAPVAVALGLALAEVARSHLFTGFPWALIGHVWIETPVAQLAALGGPHGLTLLTLAVAVAIALALVPGGRIWPAPVAVLAVGGLFPLLDPGAPGPADPAAPVVRLVQPNAPQDEKWDPERAMEFLRRMLAFTAEPGSPDVTIWPETAVPWLLEHSDDLLVAVTDAARGRPVVLGIQRREGSRYFNSLAVVGAEGRVTGLYDKWHLVPFGEYMPFGEVFARLGIHGIAASEGGGYSAGTGPALLALPGIGTFLPLICYEGIFAEEVNAAPTRPRLMVLITNDAWFGTSAGPQQHFAQGRLRAIEQGLPMVRVANTGISGVIDGRGRVIASIPMGVADWRDVALPEALGPTPYVRLGDWPVGLLLAGLLCGAVFAARRFPIDPPAAAT